MQNRITSPMVSSSINIFFFHDFYRLPSKTTAPDLHKLLTDLLKIEPKKAAARFCLTLLQAFCAGYRIDMHHAVLYQRKIFFDAVVYLYGYIVGLPQGLIAVGGNFHFYIHFGAKKPRPQQIQR